MDKIAIVTGGTGYLGREIVKKFADNNYKVYVPSLSLEEFNNVFDTSGDENTDSFKLKKIFSFVCDAFNEESVIEFVELVSAQEKGKIDVLINTIGGIDSPSEIENLSTESLNKMIILNFFTSFWFTREALKIMKKNSYGRILSVGAIAGVETSPKRFAYSAAKSLVINLMKTVSEENKKTDIRANVLIPGIIDTPANREWGTEEDINSWVKPESLAEIVFRFTTNEFSDIRGTIINAYGAY